MYPNPLIKVGDGQFMFVLKKMTVGFLINGLQR